jgi:hypothetical protein
MGKRIFCLLLRLNWVSIDAGILSEPTELLLITRQVSVSYFGWLIRASSITKMNGKTELPVDLIWRAYIQVSYAAFSLWRPNRQSSLDI